MIGVIQKKSAIVAVMGATGTGKSSIIKLLTNDDNIHIGHKTESQTSDISTSYYFDTKARTSVMLIDTPGFDDSREGITDTDILEKIVAFLQPEEGEGRKLNGIIYLHRISDPRVGGVSKKNLRMFRKLCGDEKLSHVRIVTTNWDRVGEAEGSAREADLAENAFLPLIEAGAGLRRHYGTSGSAQSIMEELIGKVPVLMQIQEELNDGRTLGATSAGAIITEELEILKEKHQKELESLKKETEEAVKAHDNALRAELAEERQLLEQRVMRADQDRERLGKTLAQAQATLDEKSIKLRQVQKKFDLEIARLTAEMANAHTQRESLVAEMKAVKEKAENERRDLDRRMEQERLQHMEHVERLRRDWAEAKRKEDAKRAELERNRMENAQREREKLVAEMEAVRAKAENERRDLDRKVEQERLRHVEHIERLHQDWAEAKKKDDFERAELKRDAMANAQKERDRLAAEMVVLKEEAENERRALDMKLKQELLKHVEQSREMQRISDVAAAKLKMEMANAQREREKLAAEMEVEKARAENERRDLDKKVERERLEHLEHIVRLRQDWAEKRKKEDIERADTERKMWEERDRTARNARMMEKLEEERAERKRRLEISEMVEEVTQKNRALEQEIKRVQANQLVLQSASAGSWTWLSWLFGY